MLMAGVAAPANENAVAVSGEWGVVVATPGNENGPDVYCRLPTIFTIRVDYFPNPVYVLFAG